MSKVDYLAMAMSREFNVNYSNLSTSAKPTPLSPKEIEEAVESIRKHRVKPIWRFTREFPFIKRFFYHVKS